jgi:hypothetical protein
MIRYSPRKVGKNPIITTQTFATPEEAIEHGIKHLNIEKDDLVIDNIHYSGNEWITSIKHRGDINE